MHANVGAHEPQDVEQRGARRVDADIANDQGARSRDHARGNEECGRREVTGNPNGGGTQRRRALDRNGIGFTADRHAKGAKHPLRMVPRDARFLHTGPAVGVETRQQQRGLDLRARQVESVLAAGEMA